MLARISSRNNFHASDLKWIELRRRRLIVESSNDKDVALIYKVWEQYGAEWSPGGDFERWMDMWIDDGRQYPPDAPANVGKKQIRAGNQPGFEQSEWKMKIYPVDVQVFGDQAYTHGTYEFAFTQNDTGRTFSGTGKFLTILHKQADGSWKLAIDCFNFDAPLQ
jgi:uncharacterized protein (TIGR02246 family)